MNDIFKILSSNPYPGRGIILGAGGDGKSVYTAYFITGRSENSRNRVFKPDGNGIKILPYDAARLADPSLIIYNPIRVAPSWTIVSNGDQTDTICEHLGNGGSFESALRERRFEPDAPNFTPRISGMVDCLGRYKLSILKSAGGGASCLRQFFEYPEPQAGVGHFICTYMGDENPLPAFRGEPLEITLDRDLKSFACGIWENLNSGNRISLFARRAGLSGEIPETLILNKNEGD